WRKARRGGPGPEACEGEVASGLQCRPPRVACHGIMKRSAVLLVAASACTSSPAARPALAPATAFVRPAVEVFIEHPPALVRGKRLGLITNQSGIDRQRRSTSDLS